jgi:hypothetical protein
MAPKRIDLGGGMIAYVDGKDAPIADRHEWQLSPGPPVDVVSKENGRASIALGALITELPGLMRLIYLNGNRLDCRRSNLIVCTAEEKALHAPKAQGGSSRYKGVSKAGDKWRVTIAVSGKNLTLGSFDGEEHAARVYDEAARVHHGRFARLNFPNPDGSEGLPAWAAE